MENDSVAQSEAKNVRVHLVIWLTLSATCVLTYYNLLLRQLLMAKPISLVSTTSMIIVKFMPLQIAQSFSDSEN
jgi:hypothetical protein